ncbi:hypothetical protein HOC80_02775 [archaeon]|jgi:hypothetical protein|nr:hypothetical protein [archaeon]
MKKKNNAINIYLFVGVALVLGLFVGSIIGSSVTGMAVGGRGFLGIFGAGSDEVEVDQGEVEERASFECEEEGASGTNSFVSNKIVNACGYASTATGIDSTASGDSSTAMGYHAQAIYDYSMAISLRQSTGCDTTEENQFMACAESYVLKRLPTSEPDDSGTKGMVCITNYGELWVDNDGTFDCA